MLEEIGAGEQPRLLVFNKLDLLDAEQRRELLVGEREAIGVSAATGEGIDELRERIERAFEETLSEVELLLPYDEGGRLSELYELAGTVERTERPDGVRVSARIPAALAHRFADFAVSSNGSGADGAARLDRWSSASSACTPTRGCRRAPMTATPASTSARSSRRCSGPASGRASPPGSRSRSLPATPAWSCPARGSRCATGSRS